MTTTEANGLSVTTHFNREELKLAIIKKTLENGELDGRTLKKLFAEDLIKEGFLRTETSFILSELERDNVLIGELKPIGGGTATRHYRRNDSLSETKMGEDDV